ALLTNASMDLKRASAVSTTLAAVAGSPMWPSTRATWSEATTSVDWVTFRELATTLKPRSTNAFTIPAPIPCDAPVTIAVFRWLLMVAYLQKFLLRESILFTGIRFESGLAIFATRYGHLVTVQGDAEQVEAAHEIDDLRHAGQFATRVTSMGS